MAYTLTHTLRATKEYSKAYLDNLVSEFGAAYIKRYADQFITGLEICKQDSRSTLSITVVFAKGTTGYQRHFGNQAECIAFMQGVLFMERGW